MRLPFIRKTSPRPRVLHNWWGNGVYVDYASGNWSEGLTTFMADYACKLGESPAAAEMRLGWLRDALALPADAQPALRGFRSRSHGAEAAVGYGKAAMLFVMLQDRLGEAAFRQACNASGPLALPHRRLGRAAGGLRGGLRQRLEAVL